MTGTVKRKAGRPPLPPAPQNAGDCRALIAQETVKTKPRERTLRFLYRLLKAYERADVQAAAELKNTLLDEANQLKQAELELRRKEYRRRFDLSPLGVKAMRRQIAELTEQVRTLERVGEKGEQWGVQSSI